MLPAVVGCMRPCLEAAGGAVQHARGLLAALGASGSAACVAPAAGASSGSAAAMAAGRAGRSISTTRGIYMGRTFVRGNLQKAAAKSTLFTRDNYELLAKQRWSLAACEQVLSKHEASRPPLPASQRHAQAQALLHATSSATSLAELQELADRQLHEMQAAAVAMAIQAVPRLLHKANGSPDAAAAAPLLSQLAGRLMQQLQHASGAQLAYTLAAFARAQYSPPDEVVQAMADALMRDGATKLRRCSLAALASLMQALTRLDSGSGHWELISAVTLQATTRLQLAVEAMRAGSSASSSSASSSSGGEGSAGSGALSQREAQNIAQLAFLLDKAQVSNPEYAAALLAWLGQPGALDGLSAPSLVQLWHTLRSQWQREARLQEAGGLAAEQPPGAPSASSSGGDDSQAQSLEQQRQQQSAEPQPLQEQQQQEQQQQEQQAAAHEAALTALFGPAALPALADATARLAATMTERDIGQVLACLGHLRWSTPDLLAALAGALSALVAAGAAGEVTLCSAAWAAAHLRAYKPALLQPALVLAVERPGQLPGYLAGKVLTATSLLPAEVLAEQRVLLAQELHRRSDARGPPPSAEQVLADGGNPAWVTSLADDLATRVDQLTPRELGYVLFCIASTPGAQLHAPLFAAAAAHIEAAPGAFGQFRDMEQVAAAFEKLAFRDGLPALKALQARSLELAAAGGEGAPEGGA